MLGNAIDVNVEDVTVFILFQLWARKKITKFLFTVLDV
jgi:hypothetical protein